MDGWMDLLELELRALVSCLVWVLRSELQSAGILLSAAPPPDRVLIDVENA